MNKAELKRLFCKILIFWLMSGSAFALGIFQFASTDAFIKQSRYILIADCVSIPTSKPELIKGQWVSVDLPDRLYKVEVNAIRILKGDKPPGKQIIATIYPMVPGKRYLLSSLGGSVIGEGGGIAATDFVAVPQLSVVEVPSDFDLKTLEGKDLKEQMQSIFSRHLYEVERQLAPLLEQKGLLEKATADRKSEWFESSGPVKLGPIVELTSTNQHWLAWLDLEGKKLEWSASRPGKDGFFYYQALEIPRPPYWEFSRSNARNIEDLINKPLKVRFFGYYTPGNEGQDLHISVGQILIARTVEDPQKIYIIQIVRQSADAERVSVRYAIIQP